MTLAAPSVERTSAGRKPRKPLRRRTSLFAHGEPMVWLTGGTLVLSLAMIAGLLGLVFYFGTGTFWPSPATQLALADGTTLLGEATDRETYDLPHDASGDVETAERTLIRIGNFELTGRHFEWVSDFELAERADAVSYPEWAIVVERMTWGRFYGTPKAFRVDGVDVATTPAEAWRAFEAEHAASRARFEDLRRLKIHDVGDVARRQNAARLELRAVELEHGAGSPEWQAAKAEYAAAEERCNAEFQSLDARRFELEAENARHELVLSTADGQEAALVVAEVVRAYPANQLGFFGKVGVYLSRWWEFLSEDPRESNSEGGVFPAIFGTVAMTLFMSIIVVPFGVLAALYLREYARQGFAVSAVRIAVNNLAGVPSIVFGVFGLGFFCYILGAGIDDSFFAPSLPTPTFGTGGLMWASLTLALLTLPVVIVATEEALSAVPNSMRDGSYACGATKWQTIRRIVLPRAAPGIMTGMILAIARGAGEVAPLMLVGVVKLAPELPVDGVFPYLHAQRSFMHLGFHIYDVGFQSQNSEAAKPMVFTTTLLLILIIVLLNLLAIRIRSRLRRRFQGAAI
jgi:phosphate transport system permease protein